MWDLGPPVLVVLAPTADVERTAPHDDVWGLTGPGTDRS